MKIRIRFSKTGPLRFIGHLDVMRYFQKAIRRADIDIAYTTGFSPHQVMSFASPLGVGIESRGEYFDIEVNSLTSCKELCDQLNSVMAEGIEILSVKKLNDDAKNAMASIAAAKYLISVKNTNAWPSDDMSEIIDKYLSQPVILYEKDTKKGGRQLDLKEGIEELSFTKDGEICLLCDASSAGNINPKAVMETMLDFCGEKFQIYDYQILRVDLYSYSAKNQEELVSLGEIGED